MKRLSLSLIVVAMISLSPHVFSQQPTTMKRIVFHDVDIKKSSGVAMAEFRKVLIADPGYLRAELIVNGQTRYMLIRNKSELWEANPQTQEARLRDTAVETLSLSLFESPEPPDIQALKIGSEVEFFKSRGAEKVGEEMIDSVPTVVYEYDTLGTKLRLWQHDEAGLPVQIGIESPHNEYKVRYNVYMTEVPFDPVAFRVPERPVQQEPDTTGFQGE